MKLEKIIKPLQKVADRLDDYTREQAQEIEKHELAIAEAEIALSDATSSAERASKIKANVLKLLEV